MRAVVREVPKRDYSSRLEADWATQLELRKRAGLVLEWSYEAVTLKLAEGSRYTPDFLVVTAERGVEFHETKGHMREAAQVRLRVAARLHPWFRFVLVRRDGGRWTEEEVAC